ncbi:hypothetical protein BD779DRAFT_1669997 [Infundibulicybe gibba]|nr:hypothetical protein BD779DRAFT_1669997 [Infundibulicybe gibba]
MSSQPDQFSAHLLRVLTTYQRGPPPASIDADKPKAVDETQEAVLAAMEAIAFRMHTAALAALRASSLASAIEDAPTFQQWTHGEVQKLGDAVNALSAQLHTVVGEVDRVIVETGDGRMGVQAVAPGVQGVWDELVSHANGTSLSLADQIRTIAATIKANMVGDFTIQAEVEARGEILELKEVVNALGKFFEDITTEVTRMSLELGTEGILGSRMVVHGTGGSWRVSAAVLDDSGLYSLGLASKAMLNSINVMSDHLTHQIHVITAVITDIAHGDLHKISGFCACGEMLGLVEAINSMVSQLRVFISDVQQGGDQERSQGLEGVWRDTAFVPNCPSSPRRAPDPAVLHSNSETISSRRAQD